MRVGDVFIDALGVWLPEPYSAEQAVRDGLYDAVDFEESGLTGARVAGSDVAPTEMTVRAVRQLQERRQSELSDVGLLVHASSSWQGPEGWNPAPYIQRRTFGGTGPCWHLSMGCLGGLTAFEMAVSHLRAEPERQTVLFTSGDNWSQPELDRWGSVPGVILGDGASAVTLTKRPGFARLLSVNNGGVPDLEGMYRGNEPLYPGDVRLRPVPDMRQLATAYKENTPDSFEAMVLAAKVQLELVDRSLDQAGITIADVTRVAYVHYARQPLQMWLLDPLDLPLEKSTWEFGRGVGHIGPTDQIAAWDHLLTAGELGPGDHLLLVGLGPGMTIGSAVVEILERPRWLDGSDD
ncbi:ketoacyl-ACP synthase III family protein [Streptomyces cylindrosporus]|uniref:Ketoacyl-ACP synthase III family protein n=1 Tax=Streptomyces cylindrosporus TaxID=2927583 RepID=A0ABS9YCS8_9ACTN|nr:ketoacyl-ACP synthase III family protein [Streptomyces cylindrosporus]MCI3275034.1 ketoacyl-ACP synthase III family protein [Streptomyces cylindrosporus]